MPQLTQGIQALPQQELENYLYHQAQLIAPDISGVKVKSEKAKTEIDSVDDVFGLFYRVWDGMILLGTFYENMQGKWVAQPCNRESRFIVNTSEQAHLAVIDSYLLS